MDSILSIGTKISTPMMLSGFVSATFFLVARLILQKNIFPKLTQAVSGKIVHLLIDRFFWLALIGMLLGFGGFVIERLPQEPVDHPNTQKTPTANTVVNMTKTIAEESCSSNNVISIGGSYNCGK